jgi:hypothetical protein
LLRPGIRVPGIRDLLSGCLAVRLAPVKALLRERGTRLLDAADAVAGAELVARAASVARRIAAAPLPPTPSTPTGPPSPGRTVGLALQLWRAGRSIRVRPFVPPAAEASGTTAAPGVGAAGVQPAGAPAAR